MAKPTPPSQPPWRLVLYISESGACDVKDFMDEMHERDFTAFTFFQENIYKPLLAGGPIKLPSSYWTRMDDGFCEMKWDRYRIYCCVEPERRVFALVAVEKRWRAFESRRGKFKSLCETRRAEIRGGNYNEAERNAAYQEHRKRRGKR